MVANPLRNRSYVTLTNKALRQKRNGSGSFVERQAIALELILRGVRGSAK
jgi:hypothetical protein